LLQLGGAGKPPLVLRADQVNDALPNKFIFGIRKDNLFDRKLSVEPHIRDRHFQILTELRPIFNPRLIYTIKRELISKHVTGAVTDKWGILTSHYFSTLMDQMGLDTQPGPLTTPAEVKRFVYRVLNILALKVSIIGICTFEAEHLRTDDALKELFERLCEPGVIKAVRFMNAYQNELGDRSNEKLISIFHHIIEPYCVVLSPSVSFLIFLFRHRCGKWMGCQSLGLTLDYCFRMRNWFSPAKKLR